MKRITLFLCCILILFSSAFAEIEQNPLLDVAFSMLEENNIFLERYQQLTGTEIQIYFPAGLPYFFGGTSESLLFSVYPQMRKRVCNSNTIYYQKDCVYLYGFDCGGYARWICSKCGLPQLDSISNTLYHYADHQSHYIYSSCSALNLSMPAWDIIGQTLQIGDFFFIHHGSYHIMMYIGTLADYGFTAEELPELAAYLNYPLVIHSGPTPAYAERYQPIFDADYEYYKNCLLMDGGVQVSIVGVAAEEVPHFTEFQKQSASYFLLGDSNQIMTDILTDTITAYCWYRNSSSFVSSAQPMAAEYSDVKTPIGMVRVLYTSNVRQGPSTNFSIVDVVYQDETYSVYEENENWFLIKLSNGDYAYLSGNRCERIY